MVTKNIARRIVFTAAGLFLSLVLVLGIHIYVEMSWKAPGPHTRAMARINIKDPLSQANADSITRWLYHQEGVDHVLVNPQTKIVVFTFFPAKTSSEQIIRKFKMAFTFKASQYIPTEEEIQSGCPVASTSETYKIYSYIRQIF